jgi:hypothetical protein
MDFMISLFYNPLSRKLQTIKALVSAFFIISVSSADIVGYRGKIDIYDVSGEYVAYHFHDWSQEKRTGKIELVHRGEILFFKETTAFTYIKVFEKYKLIVLLSKIRIDNANQIQIIGFDRSVLLKKQISMDSVNCSGVCGIKESGTDYISWYNEKDPGITITDKGDSYTIAVNSPNNKIVSYIFPKIRPGTRKGMAGIGYGPGYGKSTLPDSLYQSLIDSTDSSKMALLRKSGFIKIRADTQKYVKGGSLNGVRSKANIMRTIMQNLASLRYQYNSALREKPGLKGVVVVKLRILSMGKVCYCKIIEATLIDDSMHQNIVEKISGWDFGEIDDPEDTTEVVYPFVFSR